MVEGSCRESRERGRGWRCKCCLITRTGILQRPTTGWLKAENFVVIDKSKYITRLCGDVQPDERALYKFDANSTPTGNLQQLLSLREEFPEHSHVDARTAGSDSLGYFSMGWQSCPLLYDRKFPLPWYDPLSAHWPYLLVTGRDLWWLVRSRSARGDEVCHSSTLPFVISLWKHMRGPRSW